MRRRQFFGQLQDVLMLAADDPVTADFRRVGRREAHGDGIVVHIQSNEQEGAFGDRRRGRLGAWRAASFL